MVDSQQGMYTELAIIISYPTGASGVNYCSFFKHPQNMENSSRFSACFNFEQTRTVTIIIWRAWYNVSYTMMAKPIRALELHYPMIQF